MGDSPCLLHGFSYASAVPNESKQGNRMHALGESISFGRFTADSLSWERWSTFSHKKYVEEAERYARPGSVAQKKAFFEAHYKRIAAQRAAAALLEQEIAANKAEIEVKDDGDHHPQPDLVDLGSGNFKIHDRDRQRENGEASKERSSSVKRLNNLENHCAVSVSESSETSQAEKPLLKHKSVDSEEVSSGMSKRRTGLSSMNRTRRIPSTPAKARTLQLKRESKSNVDALDGKRSSPKTLRALLSLGSFRESISKNTRTESSGLARTTPKDCSTPAPASTKSGVPSYPAPTPQSEKRRMKTPDPSASGRKTTGPKWHILSAVNKLQSPTVSAPFTLRTEERAAKRKQKLEGKFNAMEVQKSQQKTLKEKAGNKFRKLSCSLCFKARTLPDLYKEREPPNNHTKKPQAAVLGRSVSNKKQGTFSMPPPPLPRSLAKTSVSKNLPKKKVVNQRLAHENASPNIQQ